MAGIGNLTLPDITADSLNDAQERRKILEALYQLKKELRYVLSNLGAENMSQEYSEKIETAYRASEKAVNGFNQTVEGMGGMRSRITQAENNITSVVQNAVGMESRITANEKGIALAVTKDGVINAINLSEEAVTILANKINLNGAISANGTFSIDTSGYMQCTGGRIANMYINGQYVSISSDYPFYVGGITMQDETISGVVSMPHLQLVPYNLGVPSNLTSGFLTVTGSGFGLGEYTLEETWDETAQSYRYSLVETGIGGESLHNPVSVEAYRINAGYTTWYTDAACTEVGGSMSPNDTFKVGSGNLTIGKLAYDSDTGLWRRSDTVSRYLSPSSYYTVVVRLAHAGA